MSLYRIGQTYSHLPILKILNVKPLINRKVECTRTFVYKFLHNIINSLELLQNITIYVPPRPLKGIIQHSCLKFIA